MKQETVLKLLPLFLFLIILGLIGRNCSNKAKLTDATNTLEWLNDSIVQTKNKLGEASVKTSVLELQNTDLLLSLETSNKAIQRLQLLADKYKKEIGKGGSITVIHDTISITDTIDGIANGDTVIYRIFEPNHWYAGAFTTYPFGVSKKGILNIAFKNEYSIIIGEERQGLFKKPKPFALVTNLNPYAAVEEVKVFKTSVPKKHWNISAQVGGGISTSGFVPYIGIGLGYKLIEF